MEDTRKAAQDFIAKRGATACPISLTHDEIDIIQVALEEKLVRMTTAGESETPEYDRISELEYYIRDGWC